ncbi:MAG: hypothetical protein LAO56_13070 [Acidobacteriia bacterium]|nr:hypothetical protein [Terriglobia bacterium]
MLAVDDHNMPSVSTPLEIVWRNPLNLVQEQLKAREESHPYYRWAEHARKIRARQAKWNVNHRWAA